MGSDTGRTGRAYRQACAAVRARAKRGELCYFYGQAGHETCPGVFDWYLPAKHKWAFTVHHLHRIMDGGEPVPDQRLMCPAHRSCNSRDGLYAQNARRVARKKGVPYVAGTTPAHTVPTTPPTSREW